MEINFNITEHIETVSESKSGEYTLELNKVSWNGRDPKLDLRRWHNEVEVVDSVDTIKKTPQKGLTLNDWELEALKNILNEKCQ